jgi:hypothetical protein
MHGALTINGLRVAFREDLVDIHISDDQIGRYFRRRQLGLRLLSHGARPQTVQEWSGLTRDQLVTLRRRWAITAEDGRRGPSPSSFEVFFGSARVSNHAALFASLCQIVGAIPAHRGKYAAKGLQSLENGERLCEAFELLKEWVPNTKIEFEQAVLLAVGVVEASAIQLSRCANCGGATLIDRMGSSRTLCSYCRRRGSPLPAKVEGGSLDGADSEPKDT